MGKFSIEVIGVPELVKYMRDKQEELKKALPEEVKDVTLFLHGQVKESIAHGTNAPIAVDTGRFLNSVDFAPVDSMSARIFTDVEYAQFIEYGTRKMESRPHFRNTLFVNENNIKNAFNNTLSVIFK